MDLPHEAGLAWGHTYNSPKKARKRPKRMKKDSKNQRFWHCIPGAAGHLAAVGAARPGALGCRRAAPAPGVPQPRAARPSTPNSAPPRLWRRHFLLRAPAPKAHGSWRLELAALLRAELEQESPYGRSGVVLVGRSVRSACGC